MLQPRLLLILSSIPMGVALGVLVWIASGDGTSMSRSITDLRSDLGKPPSALSHLRNPTGALASSLATRPIFVLSVGPGALQEATVQLIGVAITPRSKAALIAINGGVAEWMKPGDTVKDVTIGDITPNGVDLDTPLGPKHVGLNDVVTPPSAAGPAGASQAGAAPATNAPKVRP